VVVVLSLYVPLELAVQVPLTLRVPATVTFLQLEGSSPAIVMSRFPLNFKHDGVTVQVPTTSPPHGVTLVASEQAEPPPPAPPLPEAPPVPDEVPELPHAPESIPNAITVAITGDWNFIERLLPKGKQLPLRGGARGTTRLALLW
jgi:hypothetical protein